MTSLTPFQHLLGAAMDRLPAPVSGLHSLTESVVASGRAEITAAPGVGAWLICRIAGLPRPGLDVPVSVSFYPDPTGHERWRRRFGTRRYSSTMVVGKGREAGLLVERFGPFRLLFQLTPEEKGLGWSLAGWRLLGLPLPSWSRPTIECLESGANDRFNFDINVAFPVVGQVVHYRGWLERQEV